MRYRYLGVLLWIVTLAGIGEGAWGSRTWAETDQVQVEDVQVKFSQAGPVVLLKVDNRSIQIFVDPTVAGSIEGALTGRKFHRPLSHDLMHSILESYAGKVTQVVIRLKDQIYYGELTPWLGKPKSLIVGLPTRLLSPSISRPRFWWGGIYWKRRERSRCRAGTLNCFCKLGGSPSLVVVTRLCRFEADFSIV